MEGEKREVESGELKTESGKRKVESVGENAESGEGKEESGKRKAESVGENAERREKKAVAGGPLLVGSISLSAVEDVKVTPTRLEAEVKPLTQEDLDRYWQETAAELHLEELMGKATVRVGEHHGRFEVDAQTTYFADDFKPHKIEVLEVLRKKTGMRLLDCRVNPLFVSQEEKVYSPEDKYSTMLQSNPKISGLRHLFPEVDY